MLGLVCAEIRNFFTYDSDKHFGDFSITDGVITPSFDIRTDYIRIVGSRKNDGVYKTEDLLDPDKNPLRDEDKFHGAVWEMSVPQDFLDLVAEIEAWQDKYGGVDSTLMSPFQSESFGGYSYSKASGGSDSGSSVPSWKDIYGSRLNVFRKIRI